jgi:hypothetical protein
MPEPNKKPKAGNKLKALVVQARGAKSNMHAFIAPARKKHSFSRWIECIDGVDPDGVDPDGG